MIYHTMHKLWKQRVGGAIIGVGGFAMIIIGIALSTTPLIIIGVPLFMVGALVVSFH
jgi:hypothetical protein